jgi:hypothetical protein
MEIGFSTAQLIDIGLNIAGFLTAGLLLMLARSLFAARPFFGAEAESKGDTGDTRESVTGPDEKEIPEVEFVDLKSVDWQAKKDTTKARAAGSLKDKNRLEIINMAKQMLAGRKSVETNGSDRNAVSGIPAAGGHLNPQGTGRSR